MDEVDRETGLWQSFTLSNYLGSTYSWMWSGPRRLLRGPTVCPQCFWQDLVRVPNLPPSVLTNFEQLSFQWLGMLSKPNGREKQTTTATKRSWKATLRGSSPPTEQTWDQNTMSFVTRDSVSIMFAGRISELHGKGHLSKLSRESAITLGKEKNDWKGTQRSCIGLMEVWSS